MTSTAWQLESWPLNGISIFPFNADQIQMMNAVLVNSDLRLVLLPARLVEAESCCIEMSDSEVHFYDLLRLARNLEAGLPSVLTPGFHTALDWEILAACIDDNAKR